MKEDGKLYQAQAKVKHSIKYFFYEVNRRLHLFFCKILHIKPQNKVSKRKAVIQKYGFIAAILILPVINFCLFYIYCNFSQILLAFQKTGEDGNLYFTFENFITVYKLFGTDGNILSEAFKNTFIFFFLSNFIMFPLAIFWSYAMKKSLAGTSFFRVIFYLPSILSSVAITSMINYMIGTDGPIGVYFRAFTGLNFTPSFFSEEEYALKCLIIYSFWMGFGGNIILLSGAMSKVSDEILEAAAIDGITLKDELFKIVIPLCWPTFSTLIILAMTGLFSSSGEILLFTQGKAGTYTISYWMFEQVKEFNSYNVPSALGLVLTVILFPLVMTVRHLCNKVYADVEF